jgi:hypothetical protein
MNENTIQYILYFMHKKVSKTSFLVSAALIDAAETDFDDFQSEYLSEYEAICEMVIVR